MIVVFAGAGASAAVSSEKYPTTEEYFKRLPPDITGNSVYQKSVADIKKINEPLDIENVLFRLKALQSFTKSSTYEKNPDIEKISHHRKFINSVFEDSNLGSHLDTLINKINQQTFKLYSQLPTTEEIVNNWLSLANLLLIKKEKIDIFTTNYDLVIEILLQTLKTPPISDGFVPEGIKTHIMDQSRWATFNSQNKEGLLTKLHGSINWEYSNKKIVASTTDFSGDLNKHPMIYPGHKGMPSMHPFMGFHQYFQNSLKNAEHIIFIGFAFRDQYINNLITSLNPRARVTSIGLGPEPVDTPHNIKNARSGYTYLDSGFGSQSITDLKKLLDNK